MKLKKHEDDYQVFLTRFTEKIIQIVTRHSLPQLENLPDIRQVKNAFQELSSSYTLRDQSKGTVGPSYSQFVYVAGKANELQPIKQEVSAYGDKGGVDWKPYFPISDKRIAIIAQTIASMEEFLYETLPLNEQFIEKLDEARDKSKIVIIIVDPWTLRLQKYADLMSQYDQLRYCNCAILVAFNHEDDETNNIFPQLTNTLQQTFVNNVVENNIDAFRSNIGSIEQLNAGLIEVLHRVRDRIIQVSNIRKIPGEGYRTLPTLNAEANLKVG